MLVKQLSLRLILRAICVLADVSVTFAFGGREDPIGAADFQA